MSATAIAAAPKRIFVYRHSVLVRITHWINVVCIFFLVMSGLQIFNAHPALYWGQKAAFDSPILSMTARYNAAGVPVGQTMILGHTFDTTGVLGLSTYNGTLAARGFPAWATLPSYQDLATGRRWHFFFAWIFVINGAVYLIASLLNRHVVRDLLPTNDQFRHIGHTIVGHLRLHFPRERDYNVIQKLTYLLIIFIVLPLIVLAGITMSPGLDSAFPGLLDFFGGRQSARTVHFICATLIVLFIVVHVILVLVSGVWNNIRSMITGRYRIDADGASDAS